MEKIVEDII